MSKYELTISPDYVPEWGVVDAVRELFQNAVDQQAVMPGNDMFFKYDAEQYRLTIGNKKSVLEASSLLLGKTTKAGDDRTIGKFGEGYKIATLVLLRLGYKVTFYNYGKREVWRPRLVESRRYGSRILTFFVDKVPIWDRVPEHDLTIDILGITPADYEQIVASNLHLQPEAPVINTPAGRILLDEKQRGRVYVNGLYVCNYAPYRYGYDFKPSRIHLDRDRRLVSDWELKWLASGMWAYSGSEKIIDLAVENAEDVAYVMNQSGLGDRSNDLFLAAYNKFLKDHGWDAIPVTCQADLSKVPPGKRGVIVSGAYGHLVTSCSLYSSHLVEGPDPLQALRSWFDDLCAEVDVPGDSCARFDTIVDALDDALGGK